MKMIQSLVIPKQHLKHFFCLNKIKSFKQKKSFWGTRRSKEGNGPAAKSKPGDQPPAARPACSSMFDLAFRRDSLRIPEGNPTVARQPARGPATSARIQPPANKLINSTEMPVSLFVRTKKCFKCCRAIPSFSGFDSRFRGEL